MIQFLNSHLWVLEEMLVFPDKFLQSMYGLLGGPVWSNVGFTVLILAGALVLRWVARRAVSRRFGTTEASEGDGLEEAARDDRYSAYWLRKVSGYAVWTVAAVLILLVWADFGGRLGVILGGFSAGLAFALQNVISSIAAWIIILTSKVFKAGDRVMMGGVRGDVVDVSPLRTSIMEMGSPNNGEDKDSETWINARQYTGRLVTVSNKTFFEDPVYNYSKDFEYIWEEIVVPISYKADWETAKYILQKEVEDTTSDFRRESAQALSEMSRRYLVPRSDVEPQVFVKLTDNWIELSARFVIPVRSARRVKSSISENLMRRYSTEGIGLASETSEIVSLPPLRVEGLREMIDGTRPVGSDNKEEPRT
ncbi:MAG: mechanosensitive ion channel family protein [Rubrobacteraceae bacterium]